MHATTTSSSTAIVTDCNDCCTATHNTIAATLHIQATTSTSSTATGSAQVRPVELQVDKVQSVELQSDITAPTAYSIQEARLKTESDAAAANAELKKDVARAVST
jgi:hypothetical protein